MPVDLRDDNVSEYEFKLWRQYHAGSFACDHSKYCNGDREMLPVSDAKRID